MSLLNRQAVLIANKPFKFRGKSYEAGDRFEYAKLDFSQRRKVETLMAPRGGRKIVEITPETMKSALRFRPADSRPPRGFTKAGLQGLGILTEEQIASYPWWDAEPAAAPEWAPPKGSWKVYPAGDDTEKSTDDTLWIVPHRTGGVTRYFVHDLDGANLNGDATINGKANAEKWARDFMIDRARRAAEQAQSEGGEDGAPTWEGYADDPADWTDEQVEAFVAWFDALPEDADPENPTVYELPEGVAKAFKERRDARAEPAPGDETDPGMNEAEVKEMVDGMKIEDLVAFLAKSRDKEPSEFEGLNEVALREMVLEDKQTEQQRDGNIQPQPDDAQG